MPFPLAGKGFIVKSLDGSQAGRSRESASSAVARRRKALPCGRIKAESPRLIGCRISNTYAFSGAADAWLLRCKVTLPVKARKKRSTASGGDRAADEGRLDRGTVAGRQGRPSVGKAAIRTASRGFFFGASHRRRARQDVPGAGRVVVAGVSAPRAMS